MSLDVGRLADSLPVPQPLPMLIVGSGGSLSAADLVSSLHEEYANAMAKAVTPLELDLAIERVRDVSVLFLTAGGSNPDILGAFKRIMAHEPRRTIVICGRKGSKIASLARSFPGVNIFDYQMPSGRDGFLATNSLLAFAVLLTRAYAQAAIVDAGLPADLDVLAPAMSIGAPSASLKKKCRPLWARDSLVVLYGPATRSAALDIESKFTEAALGSVQLADFRNFGHGRHHWLAKRGDTSAVLALVSKADRSIASKTLRLLPTAIPRVKLPISRDGVAGGLEALVYGLHIAAFAGEHRGIDPGRPSVPQFGRRLYHLSAFPARPRSLASSIETLAIERKAGRPIAALIRRGALSFWQDYYRDFLKELSHDGFNAVVFDYDGTLCDSNDRIQGWRDDVASHIVRLLRDGIVVGIVSGRGKSLRMNLRERIPEALWSHISVGYYNGADVAMLSDDSRPECGTPAGKLAQVSAIVHAHPVIIAQASCECRHKQVSIIPHAGPPGSMLWDAVQASVAQVNDQGITAVRSGHSIDVLAAGVSKQAVVNQIRARLGQAATRVLCVGDRGRWPGNDHGLLSGPHSLSVAEVSADPATCWNLTPSGRHGASGALYYLERIRARRGRALLLLGGPTRKVRP
jgi:hypothetical protein